MTVPPQPLPDDDLSALDECALLDRFVAHYDRAVAGEVARRYAGLAYGACHRLLDNGALAEDAAFTALKQVLLHPRSITASLAGSVHRIATDKALGLLCQLGTKSLADSSRIRSRGAAWSDVAPLIDHALGELPAAERSRLLAAYVLPATGTTAPTCPTGRDAAALQRLRTRLAAKGLHIEVDVLAGLFAANGREPPPASLIATVQRFVAALPVLPATPAASRTPLRELLLWTIAASVAITIAAGALAFLLLRRPTPAAPPPVPATTLRTDTAERLPLLFAAVIANEPERVAALLADDPALARAWGPWTAWDRRPWTALHLATSVNQPAIIEHLLAAGADPLAARPENDGLTPLDTCANPSTGRPLLARLGNAGDAAWAAASGGLAGLERALVADPALVTRRGAAGRSLLHVAVARGVPDAALLLIARGATLDAEDAYGWTPLRASFPTGAGEAHARTRQDLIARGARWDLASAALAGRADVVETLLREQPALTAQRSRAPGEEGRSVLHAAACAGDAAIVRRLAAAGCDPRLADEWGVTPLHCAAAAGRIDAVRALLALGADPKAVDQRHHATPAAWARRAQRADAAEAIAAWTVEVLPVPRVEPEANTF